jgi:hypothetical protein
MSNASFTFRGIALSAIALLALSGCGYSQAGNYNKDNPGYRWHSLYREDVQTVAVPIFTNKTFRRGVEFQLTTAIAKQLETHTPYKIVPRERADTIIEGEIVAVDTNTTSEQYGSNIPQEQVVTYTINFVWKRISTGEVLVERRNYQQTATFYPTLGESSFVGDQTAVEQLAQAIVQELQADW